MSLRGCGFCTQSHVNCGTHCHRMWWTTRRCTMSLGKSLQWFSPKLLGEQNKEQLSSAAEPALERTQPPPAWVGDTLQSHWDAKTLPMALDLLYLSAVLFVFGTGSGEEFGLNSPPTTRVILDWSDKEQTSWWNVLFWPPEIYKFLNPNNSHCMIIRSWAHGQLLTLF